LRKWGGEDGRHEEFVGVGEMESARGVRVLADEPAGDLAGATGARFVGLLGRLLAG